MPKDELGHFSLPDKILDILSSQQFEELVEVLETPAAVSPITYPAEWTLLTVYEGSPRDGRRSKHTVDVCQLHTGEIQLRCTCQGFRIHKKGYCKHTERAAEEFGITNG